jgi:hypothetical protein
MNEFLRRLAIDAIEVQQYAHDKGVLIDILSDFRARIEEEIERIEEEAR